MSEPDPVSSDVRQHDRSASFEHTEHARMLRAVVFGIWIIATAFVGVAVVFQPEMIRRALLALTGIAIMGVTVLGLEQTGRGQTARWVLVIWMILQLGVTAITAGGIRSPGINGYLAIVLLAGILLGGRNGVYAGILCALVGAALVTAELNGWLPAHVPYTPVTLWLLSCIYIGIVIMLQRMAARTITDALRKAESELQRRMEADEERERVIHERGERVKELMLLHFTARLLQFPRQFDLALLDELVNEIPKAWQYPEVCEACISYWGDRTHTAGWRDDPTWKQEAHFRTSAGSGCIAVAYTAARPDAHEGPFLAEERALLQSLAEMFVAHIEGDIAREKQRDLEHQLRQSQKIQALGTLAGGIAHDFNNILTAVQGNVDLARLAPADSPLRQSSIEEIAKASNRAQDLVKRILLFSRKHEAERKIVNITPVVEDAVSLLRASMSARVEIETRIAPDLPHLWADATQLHQVLMNLGTNAAHALEPSGGTLRFAVESVEIDHADLPSNSIRPGTFLRITVCDDGVGMATDVVDRVFEPFFTTKGVAGTGLGLSVVYGIVREHQGVVTVDSALGEGTTFRVYLPAASESEENPPPATSILARGAGERIMYVDDEEAIVFVFGRLLEELGYDVICFTDSGKALAAFRADPASFDAVITDFNMPGMTGSDFAKAIREIREEIPLVLVSGADKQRSEEPFTAVLPKPIRIEDLSVLLHELLGNSR